MTVSTRFGALAAFLLLAACVSPGERQPLPQPQQVPTPRASVPRTDPAPPSAQFIPPIVQRKAGLEDVIGRNASALQRLFGAPRLTTPEGDAVKLQFRGEPCVLDVYLYPLKPGGEAVATHTEALRARDGAEVDQASCVAALRRD